MNKSHHLLPFLLGAAIISSQAAELSVSGLIDADVAGISNSNFDSVVFQNNHEIDLVANLKFSEMVSLDLLFTSVSGIIPAGGGSVADRWTTIDFDGVALNIQTANAVKFNVGDLTFTEGKLNYYLYRRTIAYAGIMSEKYVRGLGIGYKGAYLAVGATDGVSPTGKTPMAGYLSYGFQIPSFTIKPFAYMYSAQENDFNIISGISSNLKFGAHSLALGAGMLKEHDLDATITLFAEPALVFGELSLAATAFYAITGDNPSTYSLPQEAFFYVEPGYKLSQTFAIGLPIELHTGYKNVDDNVFALVPTFYVYPAEGVQWWIWNGIAKYLDDATAEIGISFGSEIIVNF